MKSTEENTGDRLTWRQAIILLVAMVAFVFISRAVYDFFHVNAHLRPIERHGLGSN
jgi:small neutral amino acid transporter SnatA (MarC family)